MIFLKIVGFFKSQWKKTTILDVGTLEDFMYGCPGNPCSSGTWRMGDDCLGSVYGTRNCWCLVHQLGCLGMGLEETFCPLLISPLLLLLNVTTCRLLCSALHSTCFRLGFQPSFLAVPWHVSLGAVVFCRVWPSSLWPRLTLASHLTFVLLA